MKTAFECISDDRNIVSRTAPIAELNMAAPEIFESLGPWNECMEKLASFIDRYHAAMTPEVKQRISQMKDDGFLLPMATQLQNHIATWVLLIVHVLMCSFNTDCHIFYFAHKSWYKKAILL